MSDLVDTMLHLKLRHMKITTLTEFIRLIHANIHICPDNRKILSISY